jgi:cell division protein FtsA
VRRTQNIITGLDVGTTKVCAVIGEVTPTGVDVIGIGQHASRGLRKGVVANVESTVEAIKRAISEAEQAAGVEVDAVYVSIGGGTSAGSTARVSWRSRDVLARSLPSTSRGQWTPPGR